MILAVDTGASSLGWALCESGFVYDCGAELHPPRPGEPMQDSFQRRIKLQAQLIDSLLPRVSAVYVEALSFPRNARAVASVSLCWGALISLCHVRHVPIYAVTPKEWQHRLQSHKGKVDQKRLEGRIVAFLSRYCSRASLSFGRLHPKARPHAADACGIGIAVSGAERER